MKFPKSLKKPLTGLALLAAGASADAGLTTNIDVGYNTTANGTSNPSGMGSYGILITTNNTYNSIIFDKLDITGQFANYLADSIVAANSNADKNEIMNDYMSTLVIPTGSDVDNGWQTSMDTNGVITTSNNGIIPGVTYETFGPGKSLSIFFQGDLQDLDSNGDGTYDPEKDITLNVSSDYFTNGVYADLPTGTAYANGDINKIEATVPVVPEPASVLLAASGISLVAAGYKRRKE